MPQIEFLTIYTWTLSTSLQQDGYNVTIGLSGYKMYLITNLLFSFPFTLLAVPWEREF